jgi:heterodisulfide reductase subunit A
MNKHSVLVVGAGVAGLQVSADLADTSVKVCLVEREPRLGGHAPLLHLLFPTLENATELTKQLIQKVLNNPHVEVLTHSEIESVEGSPGSFKVRIAKRARCVDETRCTNCGECEKVCPVEVPKRFEARLSTRKAVYLPSPFAVPCKYLIDKETCLHFKDETCHACQDACPEGAVVYEQKPSHEELLVDAVVLATGFRQYDAKKVGQYKYGIHPNVITGMEFERLCNPSGPTGGKILRVNDKKEPKSIVLLLCVGSRDEKHLRYCCNIGCLNALKHAYYLKQQYGEEVDVYICYTDVRAVTKHGEQFYQKVRTSGVEFIHGQPSEVRQTKNGFLTLDVYDQATSKLLSITSDLVVLETGLQPQVGLREKLKIAIDQDGFFTERHVQLASSETSRNGVFLAGALQQPMHVHEALMHASAVAMKVSSFVRESSADL